MGTGTRRCRRARRKRRRRAPEKPKRRSKKQTRSSTRNRRRRTFRMTITVCALPSSAHSTWWWWGVRRATTFREEGSKIARATGWRAWPARWETRTCCFINTLWARCEWRALCARTWRPRRTAGGAARRRPGSGTCFPTKGAWACLAVSGTRRCASSIRTSPRTTTWSAGATTTLPRLSAGVSSARRWSACRRSTTSSGSGT
mmetsp:Transcript_5955/g.24153  ORF Transcript_5955/g.24153 Transcript_5955/m.24153 type:complete len:202 (+) Transcript_5955:725-1330(+)